jgi:transposase InsO family protein
VIKAITNNWLNQHGVPKEILSDQGRQFTSSKFKEFLIKNKIKQTFSSPYNPQGNGMVERVNSTILPILRIFKGTSKRTIIKALLTNLNFTYQRSIKCAPSEMVYSKSIFAIGRRNKVTTIQEANENSKKQAHINNSITNKKRNCDFKFKPDDQVFIKKKFENIN